jgi:hypothetical protein
MNCIGESRNGETFSFWFSLLTETGLARAGLFCDEKVSLEFLQLVGSPTVFSEVVFPFVAEALVTIASECSESGLGFPFIS